MDEEKLDLMELKRISQTIDEHFHHSLVHISVCQVSHINMKSNFEGIVPNWDLEQLNKLLVWNLFKIQSEEIVDIIILSVHIQDEVDVFCTDQKSFSVILSHSRFHRKVNEDFFKESLVVLSISLRLESEWFFIEICDLQLNDRFLEGESNEIVVPLLQ